MCLALLEKGKSFDKIRYADKLNERRTMSVTVKNSRGAVRKRKKKRKRDGRGQHGAMWLTWERSQHSITA